jgi:hypothetical protein
MVLYRDLMLSSSQQRRLFVERLAESEAHREAAGSLVRTLSMGGYDEMHGEYIDDLCKVLEACRTVTKLTFGLLDIDTLDLPRVASCIGKLGRLAHLNILASEYSSAAGNDIQQLLDAAPGLRVLGFTDVPVFFDRAPPGLLLSSLAASHPHFESFILSSHYAKDFEPLLEGVPLRTLTLNNMNEISCLVEPVAPTLENLYIACMDIANLSMTAMAAASMQRCMRLKALEIQVVSLRIGQQHQLDERNFRPALECLPPSLETLSLWFGSSDLERQVVGWLDILLKNSEWCPRLRWLGLGRIVSDRFLVPAADLDKLGRIRGISVSRERVRRTGLGWIASTTE